MLQFHASISCFNFTLQFHASISCFNFMLQFQASISCLNFKLQFHASISSFNFKLQFHASISCFDFMLQFHASISCFKSTVVFTICRLRLAVCKRQLIKVSIFSDILTLKQQTLFTIFNNITQYWPSLSPNQHRIVFDERSREDVYYKLIIIWDVATKGAPARRDF
jgi:hypothetical protein